MNEKIFIYVGRLEGVSLLFLLLIAMPMKYIMHQPELVKYAGRTHGGLFLVYVIMAAMISDAKNWDKKKLRTSWILSCLPFGTFIFEKKYMLMAEANAVEVK